MEVEKERWVGIEDLLQDKEGIPKIGSVFRSRYLLVRSFDSKEGKRAAKELKKKAPKTDLSQTFSFFPCLLFFLFLILGL